MTYLRAQLLSDQPEDLVKKIGAELGLTLGLDTTLKTYPGSTHHHWLLDGSRGVLELTISPAKREIWLSYRADRTQDWVPPMADRFMARLNESGIAE